MKKLLFICATLGLTLTGCKKEEGCTDKNATNYNEKAEKDNGSCTYEEDGGNNNGGGTDGGNNNGGGTGGGGSTSPSAAANTMSEGAVNYTLDDVDVSTSGSLTIITANKKGESSAAITIKINGALPTSTTTYGIYDPFKDGSSAGLTINSDGNTWLAADADASQGKIGSVTIEVSNSGKTFTFWFNSAKLSDNAISPTTNREFSANFSITKYSASFQIVNQVTFKSDENSFNAVVCEDNGSRTKITVNGLSSSNKSGTMVLTLPSNPSAGTHSLDNYPNDLVVSNNSAYEEYNVYSGGTIYVSRNGNELTFSYGSILGWDNVNSLSASLTGSGSCMIK